MKKIPLSKIRDKFKGNKLLTIVLISMTVILCIVYFNSNYYYEKAYKGAVIELAGCRYSSKTNNKDCREFERKADIQKNYLILRKYSYTEINALYDIAINENATGKTDWGEVGFNVFMVFYVLFGILWNVLILLGIWSLFKKCYNFLKNLLSVFLIGAFLITCPVHSQHLSDKTNVDWNSNDLLKKIVPTRVSETQRSTDTDEKLIKSLLDNGSPEAKLAADMLLMAQNSLKNLNKISQKVTDAKQDTINQVPGIRYGKIILSYLFIPFKDNINTFRLSKKFQAVFGEKYSITINENKLYENTRQRLHNTSSISSAEYSSLLDKVDNILLTTPFFTYADREKFWENIYNQNYITNNFTQIIQVTIWFIIILIVGRKYRKKSTESTILQH